MDAIGRSFIGCFFHSLKEHLNAVLQDMAESVVHVCAIRLGCAHDVLKGWSGFMRPLLFFEAIYDVPSDGGVGNGDLTLIFKHGFNVSIGFSVLVPFKNFILHFLSFGADRTSFRHYAASSM
jgi:hypothetical protein